MSKDIPEIGDVFCKKLYPHIKTIVVDVIEYKNTITYVCFDINRQTYERSKTKLKKDFKYIGKSKCSIPDLFEIKDKNDE